MSGKKKSPTKKAESTTMKKTSQRDSGPVSEEGKPMDSTIREQAVGVPAVNVQRTALSLKTLVQEVTHLFPETEVAYGNYTGRNVALDASFDVRAILPEDREVFITLLRLIESDVRISEVVVGDDDILVSVRNSPRTQDLRTEFGLNDAFLVLYDGDGSDAPYDEGDSLGYVGESL